MLLWRCYLTPHPTITVQFVLTLALASLLMLMGAGLGMAGELVPAYVGIIITIQHYTTPHLSVHRHQHSLDFNNGLQ